MIDLSLPGAHRPDAPPIAVVARPLGIQTNNFAEYTAVNLALEKALAAHKKALLDEVGARLSGLAQGSSLGLTTEQQREHIRSQLRVDGAFTSEADVKRFIDEARVISAKPRIDLVTGLLIGGERRSYYIEASANRR